MPMERIGTERHLEASPGGRRGTLRIEAGFAAQIREICDFLWDRILAFRKCYQMLACPQHRKPKSRVFSSFFLLVRPAARTNIDHRSRRELPAALSQPRQYRADAAAAGATRSVLGREAALGVFVPSWLGPVLAVAAASALRRGHRCLTDERE